MIAKPLTSFAVDNAKPNPTKRIEVRDTGCTGLRLVIAPTGAKSWAYRFKLNGKAGKLTIGTVADFTLREAREAADEARRQLARGIDPAAQKQAARQEAKAAKVAAASDALGLVPAVIDRYVADYASTRKSEDQIARILRKELLPWSKRHMATITTDDAIELLEDIAARPAKVTANRLRANARKMWGWALGLSARNRAQLGLAKLVVNPFELSKPQVEKGPRDRVLSDDEVAMVTRAAAKIGYPFGPMIRILLATLARRTEVAAMQWSELQLAGREPRWTIPAERSKNGRPHTIPLTLDLAKMISELPRIDDDKLPVQFIFTTTGGTHVTGFSRAKRTLDAAILKLLRETAEGRGGGVQAPAPWTLHDLRRTGASGMARLGVALPVVERCLNHVSGSFGGIVGVYQRHDYANEMRVAFTKWGEHVHRLEHGEALAKNVVNLGRRGAKR